MCKQAALRSSCAACLHTNQSRSYLNHLVLLLVENHALLADLIKILQLYRSYHADMKNLM